MCNVIHEISITTHKGGMLNVTAHTTQRDWVWLFIKHERGKLFTELEATTVNYWINELNFATSILVFKHFNSTFSPHLIARFRIWCFRCSHFTLVARGPFQKHPEIAPTILKGKPHMFPNTSPNLPRNFPKSWNTALQAKESAKGTWSAPP